MGWDWDGRLSEKVKKQVPFRARCVCECEGVCGVCQTGRGNKAALAARWYKVAAGRHEARRIPSVWALLFFFLALARLLLSLSRSLSVRPFRFLAVCAVLCCFSFLC